MIKVNPQVKTGYYQSSERRDFHMFIGVGNLEQTFHIPKPGYIDSCKSHKN